MFIALAERRRRIEQAREEGRKEIRKEIRNEERKEIQAILTVLSAAARSNPDLIPSLLQEYQARYENGSTND